LDTGGRRWALSLLPPSRLVPGFYLEASPSVEATDSLSVVEMALG
jgi:hypothetical protein